MNRLHVCLIAATLIAITGCPPKKEEPKAVTMDPAPADTRSGSGEMLTDANNPGMDPAPAPAQPVRYAGDGGAGGSDESMRPSRNAGGSSKHTTHAGGRTYTVAKGDTLSGISRKMYGTQNRWKDIWNANKARIKDPNRLTVGTKLIVP